MRESSATAQLRGVMGTLRTEAALKCSLIWLASSNQGGL